MMADYREATAPKATLREAAEAALIRQKSIPKESSEETASPDDRRLSHGSKVKRGQLCAVQQGRYGTGPAPYGYRRGEDDEKPLVVDDREAEVVRLIFREYIRTRSTGKVVDALRARGIQTRKGNDWSRQAIAIILSNRTYRGRVTYGNTETQGLHDPIIDPGLFYKANAIRTRKQRKQDGEQA